LKLQNGAFFSRTALAADLDRIRKALIGQGYLAPQLDEPKVTYDSEKNSISIDLLGAVGAKVKVIVDAEKETVGQKTQTRLLPVKRDGSIEFSAIKEGERRLRNHLQEKGYFFVEVEETCSVNPPFPSDAENPLDNGTESLCAALAGTDLTGKDVEVKYQAYLNRRLKLVDIRIEGTNLITTEDVISALDTQRASPLGLIPRLGYGRGYTSNEILEDDRLRLQSFMRELGYRNARVVVKQGVSTDGENLIITFVVTEGDPTYIENVEVTGNKVFATDALKTELPNLLGKNYSRARARNGQQKLFEFYAREGYYDADIEYSIVELPKTDSDRAEKVKIVYNVANEGKKVLINRVLINGNSLTRRKSIMRAINLREGNILRQTDIFTSEQNLYSSDAFRGLEIKPEPAGETRSGEKLTDVVINLEEQKPRIITYGGGYSTDLGWSGFFDFRHVNLFGRLQQGGARIRWSRRQQLVQFDFLDPRFLNDGKDRFAPLSVTAQYQRDSTVTRFFRSAFDSGTFGIVQRLDANGNPIDIFGAETGDPTINRFSLTAETNRTIDKKNRSILYLRYKYEDVRLFNIDSLLIGDLLRTDDKVRLSGFGATFVRDRRQNCSRKFTILEIISRGEPGDACRYNPADPTKGDYLSVEYNSSIPWLGSTVGFNKLQATYQGYYQIKRLNDTVLAGRAVIGIANVFYKKRQITSGPFQEFNDILPISERFFAGGSTTLRGFDFESAGPRVVVNPQGIFRDSNGNIVSLNPFTIPFGGNAVAITNLEARIPVSKSLQAVPFYDGGNVFLRAKDMFNPPNAAPGDAFKENLRAKWTHTLGFGVRIKTPFGGSLAIDYGYMLNTPQFIIPQPAPPDGIYKLKKGQIHFRFTQSF
jgi:outer membrane protein insertion porin family